MKNIKSQLSWNLKDYIISKEEPPACVFEGKTEGESMDIDQIEIWAKENIKFLSVFKEEYPQEFENQLKYFFADLDYLHKIGKITKVQKEHLSRRENFEF